MATKACVEAFFDCSSPWTYLGFVGLRRLAERWEVDISWRPILVGGVFNAINRTVYDQRANPVPAKAAYLEKDLADWARHSGLVIRSRPTIFPVNSVKAMRGCLWLEPQGLLPAFALAVFEAYWRDDLDISSDDVLAEICDQQGINRKAFFAAIGRSDVKDGVRANTDELMRRGGFGSPTFFVNGDDMYFGNDRLPLVEQAIGKVAELAATRREPMRG